MQFEQIVKIVSAVLSAISALGGADVAKFAPILTKVSAVISGLSSAEPPTNLSADIVDLEILLTTLKTSGVLTNTAPLDEALGVLNKFTATLTDLKAGQFAIIDDNIEFEGMSCVLLACTKTGPAYQLVTTGTTEPV